MEGKRRLNIREVANFLGTNEGTIRSYVRQFYYKNGRPHLYQSEAAKTFPRPKLVFGRYEWDRKEIERWYMLQTISA